MVKFIAGFKPTRSAAGLQQTTERTLPSRTVTTVGCSLGSHCKASRGNWGRVIQSQSMAALITLRRHDMDEIAGSSEARIRARFDPYRHAGARASAFDDVDAQLPVRHLFASAIGPRQVKLPEPRSAGDKQSRCCCQLPPRVAAAALRDRESSVATPAPRQKIYSAAFARRTTKYRQRSARE